MFFLRLTYVFLAAGAPIVATAEDWPTYRHDRERSGVTQETLGVTRLGEAWRHESPSTPQPAWAAPAKWDSYSHVRGLRAMRAYDRAFHVVVAEGTLYFGSSSDDSVHALDARSGKPRWVFTTDGPIRVAPTVVDGRVYFGSDDGYVYCVSSSDGKLLWKFCSPTVDQPWILNNGRFISYLPCRTGVLVDGGRAYFAFSMLPWRPSYVCAVDARSGVSEGPGRYVRRVPSATFESALLVSPSNVIFPQGRVAPLLFNRQSGETIGPLQGGGGSCVFLTSSGEIVHGPGNKTGWMTMSDSGTLQRKKTYRDRSAMVVSRGVGYSFSDTLLSAVELTTDRELWRVHARTPSEMILGGATLFVGGDNEVAAFEASSGREVWRRPVRGRVYSLAVAGGQLFASTDSGSIHCFRPSGKGVPSNLSRRTEARGAEQTTPLVPTNPGRPLARDAGLVNWWKFRVGMDAPARRRGFPNPERHVGDLVGGLRATIVGDVQLRQLGSLEALAFDGLTNSVTVMRDARAADLPEEEMSAEAWVRSDEPSQRGGIVGVSEMAKRRGLGWQLGYRESKFFFALKSVRERKTEKGDPLTFVEGDVNIQKGAWYHVVGTYDGTTQRLYVNGREEKVASEERGSIRYSEQPRYEIGNYRFKSLDSRLSGLLEEVRVYQRALSPDEISQRYEERRELFPEPVRLALGPYAEFVGPETAIVRWHTRTPSPTRLEYRSGDKLFTVSDSVPKIEHEARLSQLQRDRIAQYWVKTGRERQRSTPVFELDGHFNYSVPRVQEVSIPSAANENIVDWTAIAEQILLETGVRSGICLVLGWESGQLAYEIARHSDLRVVGVDTDPDKVESARETLRRCGVYGTRVALHVVESLSKLPFTSSFANLVVSESIVADGLPVSAAAEVSRVLRPDGGVAVLGRPARGKHGFPSEFLSAWLESSGTEGELQVSDDGVWARVVRPPLNGAGEWSHLYGRADNAAFGGEMLSGVRSSSDLRVQWIGRPGPRGQPDRNGRKPSPLSTGGRLFVQGSHRLMGLDAYNGTILWGLEIPLLERFNMPRDSSNWCADKEHLFVAIRNRCWQIDALSGQVVKFHAPIAAKRRGWKYDWSYLARLGETILGSSVKSGTGYTNFWGGAGAGWYDARSGPATFKVCSDNLFAITKATGEVAWKYEDGVIINSTITAADKRVFFVECRNAEVKASFSRRVGMNDLWHDLYLVALDGASGSVLWEKPLGTTAGTVVFYMAYGSNLLVIVSSSDKRYDVYGYNAFTGDLAWHNGFGWPEGKGDHGRAMSRPAIVGGRVFVRPQVLDLYTGKTLPLRMPAGGCGTYAATANTFIYRSEKKVSLWDSDSGEKTAWERLRPGCWLSTIPAAGMLLSPEAGGGCSCGSWMETSIGFTPLSGGGGGGSTEE